METTINTTPSRAGVGTTSIKLGNRKETLAQLAKYKKRSLHSLVLEAVDNYMEQEQARLEYEAQAVRSYENFQATGLHMTLDELESWAKNLNSKNPQSLPLCHT
jgi:predicted transcriptional regulator